MANVIRAALLQTDWTGDKESMIDKHEETAREACGPGRAGHLLPGAVLRARTSARCRRPQYYDYTEAIPDGPTTQRFQALAKELGMVMVLPMYEVEQAGVLLQHRRRRSTPTAPTSASTASTTSRR